MVMEALEGHPHQEVHPNLHHAEQQQQQQYGKLRGRSILVAVDHSPNSKHAFDWAISHLCRPHDTVYLLHVLPESSKEKLLEESPQAVLETTSGLMEKLAVEAFEAAMIKTEVLIVSGEIAKSIAEEAKRINPIAVVLGRRDRGIIKSVLHGDISEYCSHHCPCPVVLVPPKELLDQSAAA